MKNLKTHFKGSVLTSLLVGTILTYINHTREILELDFEYTDLLGWMFNYLVPFIVSLYSRIASERSLAKKINNNE